MPCYEVRTTSVEFKADNITLLKKTLEKTKCTYLGNNDEFLNFRTQDGNDIKINFKNTTISSSQMDTRSLASFSNYLKRSYSEIVIDEVAKKQKWIQRKISDTKFQLQRF